MDCELTADEQKIARERLGIAPNGMPFHLYKMTTEEREKHIKRYNRIDKKIMRWIRG